MSDGPRHADNVALLATVNHWWTRRRVPAVAAAGFGYRALVLVDWGWWPRGLASGFELGLVHLQRGYARPLEVPRLPAPDRGPPAGRLPRAKLGRPSATRPARL